MFKQNAGGGGFKVPPVAIDIYMVNLEKLTGRQTFGVASIYRPPSRGLDSSAFRCCVNSVRPALRFGMENRRTAQIDLFQITNRCLLETGIHWKVFPL